MFFIKKRAKNTKRGDFDGQKTHAQRKINNEGINVDDQQVVFPTWKMEVYKDLVDFPESKFSCSCGANM